MYWSASSASSAAPAFVEWVPRVSSPRRRRTPLREHTQS
jgi:hypothetical protein